MWRALMTWLCSADSSRWGRIRRRDNHRNRQIDASDSFVSALRFRVRSPKVAQLDRILFLPLALSLRIAVTRFNLIQIYFVSYCFLTLAGIYSWQRWRVGVRAVQGRAKQGPDTGRVRHPLCRARHIDGSVCIAIYFALLGHLSDRKEDVGETREGGREWLCGDPEGEEKQKRLE